MKRYIDHVTDIAPSGLTSWALGDWAIYKSKSPTEFVASLYYYTDAVILTKTAKLLGEKADETQYAALAEKIKTAFNNKYLNTETGIYVKGTQTDLSMPLFWGMVPENLKAKVAANLAQRVEKDNKHLDVGEFGSKTILNALSDYGYADLAYEMATQKTFPSWGWWIVNGATTLIENWNMDEDISYNHIMFGEVSAWFYKALGGIKPDPEQPGFKHILLQPNFVTGLNQTSANFQSPYGEIVSKWERKKKTIVYSITIPANSTADLYLAEKETIKKATLSSGEKISLQKGEKNTYRLEAGSYWLEIAR
jgi:alpha-L-rhamnosidase